MLRFIVNKYFRFLNNFLKNNNILFFVIIKILYKAIGINIFSYEKMFFNN